MKQFFKILMLAALALPFTGCDVEYSDINILPDPVFEQNGLYTVNTISIYDDYETVINVSRTAGLSKELELDIVVDETLLAEYNELYNTDYKLLETQFYDIPKNAQLASTVKFVDISVRIHPKALIAAKGMAAANNMLLPIRISNASTPVEDGGSMMQALLRLNIVEPIVQVEMPEQMPQLEFIPTIPLPQEITLNATANFNTLEVAKIGYRVNASKVDAYNEEHGTSYQLLPEQYYKIKESDFDTETLEIASRIEFDCAAIGGEGTYLLPLYMQRGLGYTALMAGSVFLPVGLIQGVLSAVSGYLTRYVKPLLLAAAGILLLATSFWLASRFTLHTTHRHILFVLYIRGLGMGLTFAPLNFFSLRNLTQHDMAAAAGISNSIKQLAGSVGIAILTAVYSARTAFHAAHETVSASQTYVEGVTDALGVVTWLTLAAGLPLLWVYRKKRKKTPAGNPGAAGEAGES